MKCRPARALTLSAHHLPHFLIAGETIQGLRANLTKAIETLCGVDSSVAVSSGGELFLRFISLTSLEYSVSPTLPRDPSSPVQTLKALVAALSSLTVLLPPQDYSKCKKIMIERGELFLSRISLSRTKIASLCHAFIKDGAVSEFLLCAARVQSFGVTAGPGILALSPTAGTMDSLFSVLNSSRMLIRAAAPRLGEE